MEKQPNKPRFWWWLVRRWYFYLGVFIFMTFNHNFLYGVQKGGEDFAVGLGTLVGQILLFTGIIWLFFFVYWKGVQVGKKKD